MNPKIKGRGFYVWAISVMMMLPWIQSAGQTCDGNLGENIFGDGDFGRGNTNVVSTDPQIAPGYIYQPNPPPNDGYYTITNYTGLWNLFPGWIKIYDNSPDIYGYMMVVNASNEPGLFYEQEITGLCENTLYEFSADIINLLMKNSNMILPNVSFLLNGVEEFNSGNVPEDEEWHTYGFTFTTKPGQFSLTLSLRNNAPGGLGNDLALDNISFRPCGPEALILPEEVTDICEDGNPISIEATLIGDAFETPYYQWQKSFDGGLTWENIPGATGTSYTHTNLTSGDHYYRYLVANGPGNVSNSKCRIVSNEKIIHVIAKYNPVADSICQGLSYQVGDIEYTVSGIYNDTLQNRLGCDSIVALDLTVVPDPGINSNYLVVSPSCSYLNDGNFTLENISNGYSPYTFVFEDESYALDETIYNLAGGTYHYVITDRFGCTEEENISIVAPVPYVIDLGPDWTIDLGDPIFLVPDENYPTIKVSWEPGDLIPCESDCLDLEWYPPYSIEIVALATSSKNCNASDSVFVQVNKVRKAYFPNAFSPNGDGLNDYFSVFGSFPNVKKVEKMAVYSRWGQLVFEKYNFAPNEPTAGWDGTFNGNQLEPDTFVYVIDILFLDDEQITYRGNVSLIK